MNMITILLYIVLAVVIVRLVWRLLKRRNKTTKSAADSPTVVHPKRPLSPWQRKFYTVWIFYAVSLKRVVRDRVALFFTFLFPLIFLFVFGGIFGGNNGVSFHIALINHSSSSYAKQFVSSAESSKQKILQVDKTITTLSSANNKMARGELDATVELPANFGYQTTGQLYPSGQAIIHYTENNLQAAETLSSVLQAEFQGINTHLVKTVTPFTVVTKQTNARSLSQFDYTFTGLLGFAILGTGIFGPINVFPELKKMGILRRLHTTPLRVWQYFMSTMLGYATTGLLSLALMFVVAIALFHLKVVGNYIGLAAFLAFGIVMILGIGLALGGWAKNERQVAPLANIIVFPMMFLSGTFFPRYLMPGWLQNITTFMPLTPVIDGARLIATEAASFAGIAEQLLIMAVWTVIIYFIAFRIFRWE
jgi:ABC-2 type transport system permease protein